MAVLERSQFLKKYILFFLNLLFQIVLMVLCLKCWRYIFISDLLNFGPFCSFPLPVLQFLAPFAVLGPFAVKLQNEAAQKLFTRPFACKKCCKIFSPVHADTF